MAVAHKTKMLERPDAKADLSLRWAHMPCCWFCDEAAQMSISS